MSKVSIIIITYNSEKTIKSCLDSIIGRGEVIVVDNNSSDKTLEQVEKFKDIKVIKNKENLGFGKGNNLGVQNSSGETLFFLNPDCVVRENSLEKLVDFLDRNQEIGAVGPKLLNEDGSVLREMSPFPTVVSEIMVLLRLHRVPFFNNLVYPNYDFTKQQEAEHLMGAALMVRRAVFEDVGGFDENFFLWFEETDLLKRIKEKGHKVVYYPDAVVTHLVGQSTKQLNFLKRQTIWNKSLLYYFSKHETWLHILLLLPFILLSYPAAFFSELIKKVKNE